ncbi:hypothetical protein L1049_024219 [Liquidambar formosana]|uniref:AAA+ ATPase domain-containing protein n=1 Tax=Liquidambar formosana TaxID=63359 RepID=A0AAP0S1L4_LIQFO
MADGAVSSIVKTIGEYLINSIRRQLGYLLHYNKNIEDLTKQVEILEAERAGVQQRVEAAESNGEVILANVQTWLTSVSTITQESRNFFDEEPRVNARCFNGRCPDLKLRYQRSKEAKNKTTEADRLKRDGRFDTVSCPAPPPERICPDAEDFDSRKLISKEIMEALQDDEINMIGVYGIGGVGKTTLVEAVRKQAKDGNLFDEIVMASVSQTLSIIKIQDEIADMLGLQFNAKSEKGRAGQLYARLEKKKRILVILDDIWEAVRLEDIGIPFGAKHKGCKIILTSRLLDVCNQMGTQRNFSIEVLPEQEAWNLFCKTVGDSFDSPDLHALAVQVAKECAGLPIAIVTLATALRNRSLSDWRDTANQLSKSIPSKKVFATLELSYNYLESEEAKSFFLLCCLIPEGSEIDVLDLWKYGMGLGLFQNVETVDEARERAVRLANDLKSSCLFLDGYSEEWVEIHDVVRDVGISIASRDKHVFLVRTGPGWKELPREDTFKRYTAISLKSNDIHVLPDKLECPQLQILLLDFYDSSLQLSNNFFLRMENLKVLHMTGMCFQSLPLSLRYLKNLRTLCLYGCKLKNLSIIGELVKLEILSFVGSDMEELPKEIGNLSHLRLLDLTQCEKLTKIPPDVIRGLSQLEGLYMADGFVKWEVERQGKEISNASLAELKDLHLLINLEIDVPNADLWPEDLLFENLSRFQVSIGSFDGAPSDNFLYSKSLIRMIPFSEQRSMINVSNPCSKSFRLKVVNVSTPLKDGVNGLWKASEDLQLTEMKGLKNVVYDLDIVQFQHLRRLHVKKCNEVEYIFNASDWVSHVTFPVLKKLDLYRLPNLKGIWHGQLPSGCFYNLRVVKVFGCEGLKNLSSHCIAKDFSKLVEGAAVGNMEFPHLRFLKLLRLPNLRNFCSKMKDDPNTHTEQPLFHKEGSKIGLSVHGPPSLAQKNWAKPSLEPI